MSKRLTVFGATGAQGGSLIACILSHPTLAKEYVLRGVTRNPSKPAAIGLIEKGVEIVPADMDDASSVRLALEGSYAVFAMTNFWDHASSSREMKQGKTIADAAIACNVQLLIWSSLPNVSEMTHGKLRTAVHWDSKAEVERYIRTLAINSVFFWAGFYMQNFQSVFKPTKNESTGALELIQSYPATTKIPLIDITDTGAYLAPVLFSPPEKFHHHTFYAATAYYTPVQLAHAWTENTGHEVNVVQRNTSLSPGGAMTADIIKVLEASKGLIGEWEYYGPTGPEGVASTRAIVESFGGRLTSFEEFVQNASPWFGEDVERPRSTNPK